MKRFVAWSIVIVSALLATACKKETSQGVIEAVPNATTASADTATTLPKEPSLEQVQKTPSAPVQNENPASNGEFTKNGRYVVQVSVFKLKGQARHLAAKLKDEGFPSYVASVESPTPDLSGMYYRVRIGNFVSLHAAQEFGQNTLKPKGIAFWVDKKRNDHRTMASGETPAVESPAASTATSAPEASPATTAPAEAPEVSPEATPTPAATPSTAPEPSTAAAPESSGVGTASTPNAAEPSTPAPEPVGVPEPPAPSEPAAPKDNNSWGNPVADSTSSTSGSNTAPPATPKDTSGAVEGW